MFSNMQMLSAVLLIGLVAPSAETQITAPLFAWSSQKHFASRDGSQKHVETRQVHDSLHAVLERLLQGLNSGTVADSQHNGQLVQQDQPAEVLLMVLGSQLRTSHLKSRVMHTSLEPLKILLDQSASSLTAPYVLHDASGSRMQAHKLEKLAADMQLAASVVDCSQDSSMSLDEALQNAQGKPHLVVLCTQPGSPLDPGSQEAVEAELQQVKAAHDKASALGKPQLTVYAAVPDASLSQPAMRQLLGVSADVGTCGQLCQTQVKWLEGIFAAMILALAAFSGMCCLYVLDTPTRFEKPKESGRND